MMDGIDLGDLGARLNALRNPHALLAYVARAVQREVRQHLRDVARDSQHHGTAQALGARSTGVYRDAALDVTLDVGETTAEVTVHDPRVRQRYFGGPINPVNGKALTIPATAEFYGTSPANNGGRERFVMGHARDETGRWRMALLANDRLKKLRGRKGSTADALAENAERAVAYWLIPHGVNQQADETVMPRDDVLRDMALNAAEAFLSFRAG